MFWSTLTFLIKKIYNRYNLFQFPIQSSKRPEGKEVALTVGFLCLKRLPASCANESFLFCRWHCQSRPWPREHANWIIGQLWTD